VLKHVLEQNPLELGSIAVAKASTPAFLTTALKNIGTELSDNAQVHADKFSSISVQSIIATPKKFVTASGDAVKPVEETSNTEILTSGEEIKNEVGPSELSQQAITVLEKTKTVVAEQGLVPEVEETSNTEVPTSGDELENKTLSPALSQHAITVLAKTHPHDAIEKINEVFSEVIEEVEVQETRIEFATLGLEWGATIVEVLSHHAEAIAHGLEKGAASFALIGLIAKVNKIHKTYFEPKAEGAEDSIPCKLVSLGFSIVEVLCSGLSFLSKIGIISHAFAVMGRFNLIGAFCSLVLAMIDLGNNVINYQNSTKLLKAVFTLSVAIAIFVLIAYTAAHLNVLLLILGTGIFIFNVAIPDEEEHEVKHVH
jgi:hypothetical protein